jgi:hypothetical protein
MRTMCEVASELTRDEALRRSIATSSLAERRGSYESNKTIVGFCGSCWAPLRQQGQLCEECQALAIKGWLEMPTSTNQA